MSEEKQFWEGKHFAFHQNRECEYFPCHKTDKPEEFNCLFCYCPLFALGSECGGNYKSVEGCAKDCSDCLLPHSPKAYGYIIGKFGEIIKVAEGNMKPEDIAKAYPQEQSDSECMTAGSENA